MEIALYPSGKRSKKFRSILFKGLWVSKGFAYVGVLTVFETRKGIEKMPVVLTGKSKLHVFPLRRAKENKACMGNRYSFFFTAEKHSCFSCLAQQDPKYSPKNKSQRFGNAFRGRSLLQSAPSL